MPFPASATLKDSGSSLAETPIEKLIDDKACTCISLSSDQLGPLGLGLDFLDAELMVILSHVMTFCPVAQLQNTRETIFHLG